MAESSRDKLIRYGLLGVTLAFIVIGFYVVIEQNGEIQKEEQRNHIQKVEVLQRGNDQQNPIIIVAKQYEEKQLLIKYEIEIENQFFFKVLESITLKNDVKELYVHNSKIWVETVDDVLLLSNNLNVVKQLKNIPSYVTKKDVSFKIIDTNPVIVEAIDLNKNRVTLELLEREFPQMVKPLFEGHSIWLIVYKDEFQIMESI